MRARTPLSTLLSQALVAFTIEFDNGSDHRLPHRTTRHGTAGTLVCAPWMTSMVMWINCMRWLEDGPRTVARQLISGRRKLILKKCNRRALCPVVPFARDKRPSRRKEEGRYESTGNDL